MQVCVFSDIRDISAKSSYRMTVGCSPRTAAWARRAVRLLLSSVAFDLVFGVSSLVSHSGFDVSLLASCQEKVL
jgi:hypothetical protein